MTIFVDYKYGSGLHRMTDDEKKNWADKLKTTVLNFYLARGDITQEEYDEGLKEPVEMFENMR